MLAALTFILVALSGCPGGATPPPDGRPELPALPEGGGDLPELGADCWAFEGSERDACFANEAESSGDVNVCYLVGDGELREACIYGFALSQPELCPDLSGGLRDDCYLHSANSSRDEGECLGITDPAKRTLCEGMFAVPCESAGPAGYNRSLCEAKYFRDVRKCDGTELADECRFDFALEFNSSAGCGGIVSQTLRLSCFGITTGNSYYCEQAEAQESRDLCRVIMARELESTEECEKIETGTVGQYKYSTQGTVSYLVQCYSEVGIRLRNYTVCEELANTLDQDSCYDLVARGAVIPEACGMIYKKVSSEGNPVITQKHDSCYRDLAKALGDPTVCNFIISIPSRDRFCYMPIIYDQELSGEPIYDYTLDQCLRISDENRRWPCVSELARRSQDASLCGMIPEDTTTSSATKNLCLQQSGG